NTQIGGARTQGSRRLPAVARSGQRSTPLAQLLQPIQRVVSLRVESLLRTKNAQDLGRAHAAARVAPVHAHADADLGGDGGEQFGSVVRATGAAKFVDGVHHELVPGGGMVLGGDGVAGHWSTYEKKRE